MHYTPKPYSYYQGPFVIEMQVAAIPEVRTVCHQIKDLSCFDDTLIDVDGADGKIVKGQFPARRATVNPNLNPYNSVKPS